ncbi:hypothetical protein M9Y10_044715 [Tritrichomonas musculus]|uniref:Thioredoxin domain-containing protein n=1 Tax=Tritrichomonas musculus TaxID=1915356 RepID=A0ABR2JT56_9EUKA
MYFSFVLISLCLCRLETITLDKYSKEVNQGKNRNKVWVFLLYVPFCKRFRESFTALEQAEILTNGSVKYGIINCQGDSSLCSTFKVTEYPSIVLKNRTTFSIYQEKLNPKSIVKNALSYIPTSNINSVDDFWIDDLREGKPKAILFTQKNKIPGYWAALSRIYPPSKVQFGICNEEGLFNDYNITNTPSIVFYNHSKDYVFEGLRKIRFLKESLSAFLTEREDKTPALSEFYVNEQIPEVCFDYSISCIFSYDNFVDPKLDDVRSQFKNDPFKFFVGDTHFPFVRIAKRGQYVIYSAKKNSVIVVNNLSLLPPALERVIDGGAKWIPIQSFLYSAEL